MDFDLVPEAEKLRTEVSSFLDEHMTPEFEQRVYETGDSHDVDFVRAMGERHWIAPHWKRDGFPEIGPEALHVLEAELTRREAPMYAASTGAMVANVIQAVGPEEMKADIVPRVVNGEVTIALGMSEPEAGSDVANVQTRATPAEGGWLINGQKMFTTNGHLAEYVFLLVRTDPESQRHKGLTTFLVPLDADGVEAQAVFTLSGERTNITYYSDVFVEDKWRISDVGAGWQSLMIALQDEHSAAFGPNLGRVLEATEEWARTPGPDGTVPIDDPEIRRRMTRSATELEVSALLEQRVTWMEANGQVPIAEGPMSKLFSTEALVRCSEDLTAMIGPDALRSRGEPTAVGHGHIEHGLRFSLGATIYAGSSEVQRDIIAQRRCGLPRAR